MKYLIQNKFWKFNKEYNKEKLLYLLIDRPTKIKQNQHFVWFDNESQYHREYNLPSACFYNTLYWDYKGKKIRML